ncbi:uncharacterized protein LOC127754304 isoform X2 [Oryza glaberrima]|uniref:uncharacterized protein LOC127754304 isoform X2 n=1 Tax=Oryza glaberrima TaxID=4538 RepID=UPI0001C776A1|nr:uncharacterized protein LOC127754304 isoform X2 [Oryza glaberrima]
MEFGSGGRDARARRQLQAAGRAAAYLGGGFLLLSAASSAAVRSLRSLSDANQGAALLELPWKRLRLKGQCVLAFGLSLATGISARSVSVLAKVW